MAYAMIAGLPPQFGLYCAMVPAVVAAVLSSPRHHLQLTYRLDGECIVVEKTPGVAWFGIDAADFGRRAAG